LIAQASGQLLNKNKAQAAQEQAQEMAKDPLIQMQQQELKIKEGELQIKMQKVQSDAQAKIAQIKTDQARIESQRQVDFARIEAQTQQNNDRNKAQKDTERMRLGVDVAKASAQIVANRNKPEKAKQ
jgi:hypothetical protein